MSSRFPALALITLTFGASLALAGCGSGAIPAALPTSTTAAPVASTQATAGVPGPAGGTAAGGANAAVCQTVEGDYATFLAGYSKHGYGDFGDFSGALDKIPDTENALSVTQLGADIGSLDSDAYELYQGSGGEATKFSAAELAQFDNDTSAVAKDCGTTFKLPPAS
jgi:hypothetical protein